MVSVSYSDFNDVMNLADSPSATVQEKLIDVAIDTVNLVGNLSISNMSGTAGSKTVTLTQKERAAVLGLTRYIYYGWYRNINPQSAGDVGVTPANLMENPEAMRTVRLYASMLQSRSFTRT